MRQPAEYTEFDQCLADTGRAPAEEKVAEAQSCTHPPARLYAWYATNDVLCVCCNECGAVLTGGIDHITLDISTKETNR